MLGCRVCAAASALVFLGTAAAVGQAPEETVQTLLQGLEARDQAVGFAGRVLLAYVSSPEYAQWQHDRENLPWDPGPDRPGFEGRIFNAYLVDFALDRPKWRCEMRALVSSGLDWLAFQGPDPPLPKAEMNPETMYRLSVSDGEFVYRYDRTSRTGQVLPLQPSLVDDAGGIGLIHIALVTTVPPYIPERFRGDLQARYQGTAALDGVRCHLLSASGRHPEPKGCFRVWVAPERDFGVVRFEHVETDAEGMAATYSVTRAFDWASDHATGLWMPRRWQRDAFDYPKDGPRGWAFSQVISSQEVSLDADRVEEAWHPLFPFDTTVVDHRTETGTPDPTHDVDGLLAHLRFEEPDPLGQVLRETPVRDALQ